MLIGAVNVNVALVSNVIRVPVAAVNASSSERHPAVLDPRAIKRLILYVFVVFRLVVSVGETRRKSDVVPLFILVDHEVERAGHIVAAQTDCTPRARRLDAQMEEEVGTFIGYGKSKCKRIVGGDECRLAVGVVAIFGSGKGGDEC
jgi:hypothetical protein